ncbi:MAG: hypothetical protein DRP85_03370 [Candidatus Makaraimicrobium thalassicum]|nr:MAG: hypothetical protein DRP85_03370 [Candidatus Omnitrophota bacterium]
MEVVYQPSVTGRLFHMADKYVKIMFGPIGSGKSITCIMEMLRISMLQSPHNGVRKTRWAVIRNSYRELEDTTKKSFADWIDPSLGQVSVQNNTFLLKLQLDDGTSVEAEFLFRALDKPGDTKKLLSLELTGCFINECREIQKGIFDVACSRTGRYPAVRDGGCDWYGVIMDTNPPDQDHWIYHLFEEDCPDNHQIFHQPSGISETAENVENLPPDYYTNMMKGKTKEWIKSYVHGNYAFVAEGRPVWPEYKDDHHYDEKVEFDPRLTLYIGIDFGLDPAAAFVQVSPSGQFRVIDELVTVRTADFNGMGAKNFAKLLKQKLSTRPYNGCTDIEIYGDPAGEARSQTDEITPFMIMEEEGIVAWPTHTNDFTVRREVLANKMMQLDFTGNYAFVIGPKAKMIRKSLSGGYCYKRLNVSGEERFKDVPDKASKYSHCGDAVQYAGLGALGDAEIIGGFGDQEIDYSTTNRMIV